MTAISIVLVILKSVLFIVSGLFFNISYKFSKFMMKQRNWTKEDRIVMFLLAVANICVFLVLILFLIKDIINK